MIGSSTCRHGTFSSRQQRSISVDQLFLHDGIEYDAGRLLHLLQHARELLFRAHQRMHVLDRAHLRVLHRGGLGHGGERLAGGIRDQMQMEVAWRAVGHVWKRPEFGRAAKPTIRARGPPASFHQQKYPQEDPKGGRSRTPGETATEQSGCAAVAGRSPQIMRRGGLGNPACNRLPDMALSPLVALGTGTG